MKERFAVDGQVLIVHYAELLRQYQTPPIEGIVWYYPNINVFIVDESHMLLEAPHFHGFDIGKAPAT